MRLNNLQHGMRRRIRRGTRVNSSVNMDLCDHNFLNRAGGVFVGRFFQTELFDFIRQNRAKAIDVLGQCLSNISEFDTAEFINILVQSFSASEINDADLVLQWSEEEEEELGELVGSSHGPMPFIKALKKHLSMTGGRLLTALATKYSRDRNQPWINHIQERLASNMEGPASGLGQETKSVSSFELRLNDMADTLGLSLIEKEAVLACYCLNIVSELNSLDEFDEIFSRAMVKSHLHVFLGCNRIEAGKILSYRGILRRGGIISMDDYTSQIELSPNVGEYLAGFLDDSFLSSNLEFLDGSPADIRDVSIPTDKIELMTEILRHQASPQILLYGLPGHGKTTLALAAAKASGRMIYQIRNREISSNEFLTNSLKLANVLLHGRKDAVLLVDEADRILCTDSVWRMFGEKSDKAWLNDFMDRSDAAVIWITNQIQGISLSTQRRFDLNVHFGPLNARQRFEVWKNILAKIPDVFGGVSEEEIWDLASRYTLAPSVVKDTADRVVTLPGRGSVAGTVALFKNLLDSAAELTRSVSPKRDTSFFRPCANYSLEGLTVDIDPQKLIDSVLAFYDWLEANPDDRGPGNLNVLLIGSPGTGKTELVKQLGKSADRDVLVKRASDLLGPYVGMSERLVAEAFREAEASKSILFIDEVDSLIFERGSASRSYEMSLTNELLQQMEAFRGVLICATNNDSSVDAAAFRRFSIKARFGYLKDDGKEIFFRKFFPDEALTSDVRRALGSMSRLAPGDFSAVVNKFRFSPGVRPEVGEILMALESECVFKDRKAGREIGYR